VIKKAKTDDFILKSMIYNSSKKRLKKRRKKEEENKGKSKFGAKESIRNRSIPIRYQY
jgi:hypothetical protein